MHTGRLVCKLRTIDIIAACRFRSPLLTTLISLRARMSALGCSCRLMGTPPSGPTDIRAALTLRKTSRAGTVSLWPTTRGRSPSFPLFLGQTRPTLKSMVPGISMPTTTSSTEWPRYVVAVSLGRSSASRRSTWITCAATLTRTTPRCGARLSPLDFESAAQSPWPTARSASPTTGSKSHHATASHVHNAISSQSRPAYSHAFPGEHR